MTTVMTPSEAAFLLGSTYVSDINLGNDDTEATRLEFAVGVAGWTNACVAVAFAALANEQSIKLAYVEEKKLKFFSSRHVIATQMGATRYPDASLEGELYRAIGGKSRAGSGSDSVERVVEHWFGKDVRNPYDTVMAVPSKRLLELGLLKEIETTPDSGRGKVSTILAGKVKTAKEPDLERITAQISDMQDCAHMWQQFKSNNAEVASKIFPDISMAIKVRTKTDS